jgi:Glycosyl hydrolase catalytic core
VMPRRLGDFTAFARAISLRYSGRFVGFPHVRFWSIWNEPNLTQFLAPQFNSKGKSIAPANYAKLAAAGYAGIKAGNRSAKVAIGETSPRGSDRPTGIRPIHSPGKFAELVAKANPRLRFDAWSHHPYPSTPNMPPSQLVKWPNVSLKSLPRLQSSLKTWFKRRNVEIWVTEYGHQTKPPERFGVPPARQAAYVRQSLAIARSFPFVTMFIWFVYQDDQGQPWESGLYTQSGVRKSASPSRFAAMARPLDPRNGVYAFRPGTTTPLVTLHVRKYCTKDPAGTPIGMTWRVFRAGRLFQVGQQTSALRSDCTITARLRIPGGVKRRTSYVATFDMNDINGTVLQRRLTIRST